MDEDQVILCNQAQCLTCLDTPFSRNRWDYVPCKCGSIAVDGGQGYIKRNYGDAGYKEMAIVWPKTLSEAITDAIDDKDINRYTSFGLTCHIARIIRDSGYELTKVEGK